MTKSRLDAFSDGVIAIIITIMVLELKVPHGASWGDLVKIWPVFVSYVVSFISLGIYWGNHHHLLHTIKEVRGGMLWANLHLLFWLSLIPFATAWMGENNFSRNTVIVYALLANVSGFAYYILLVVIKRCNPGNDELQEVLHKQSRKGLLSNIFYLMAVGAAFFHPAISGFFIVLVAIMWLIPDRNIEKVVSTE
jgi:uncharacterized membrane protein